MSGRGAGVVMAAFTQLNPDGGRLWGGTYGVFFATKAIQAAVAEKEHRSERVWVQRGRGGWS